MDGIVAFVMFIGMILAVVYAVWLFFFPIMIVKRLDRLIELMEKKA